ncbi:MAG TPA: hypothetical protein VL172_17470 [Kofleriaceae bacterium]|jgi:hypothetical protein|nr:hypothetical protein [Kofleriaceae bacterium]
MMRPLAALLLVLSGCLEEEPDVGDVDEAIIDCDDPAAAGEAVCGSNGSPGGWYCNPVEVYCGAPDGYDADGDGLAEGTEDCLVQASNARLYFDFHETWYSYDDGTQTWCFRNDGIYARAFRSGAAAVTVKSVISYRRDCGDGFIVNLLPHDGDSESYTLHWGYWGNGVWRAGNVDLSTHFDVTSYAVCAGHDGFTAADYRDGRLIIYSSEKKHASYPDLRTCEAGNGGADHCESDTYSYPGDGWWNDHGYSFPRIFNVGETGYRRLESPYGQWDESFWKAQSYCGEQTGHGLCPQGEQCASPLHEKLGFDGDYCGLPYDESTMCGDSCGGYSSSGCYCDPYCSYYGDCCGDGSACTTCGYCDTYD